MCGAGRLIREGKREYVYRGFDKVAEVIDDGRRVAEFTYGMSGQLAEIRRADGHNEKLYWDGLALVRRDRQDKTGAWDTENYLNEPHPTGGNPVLVWKTAGKKPLAAAVRDAQTARAAEAAATRLLFNDMLGTTAAVLDPAAGKGEATRATLFGESANDIFFTGKPYIDELGYAFLCRNYRPEHAKWQTADPLGYPDGWNALAYCNNGVGGAVDYLGMKTLSIILFPREMTRWEAVFSSELYIVGGATAWINDYETALNLEDVLELIKSSDEKIDHLVLAAHAGAGEIENTGYIDIGNGKTIFGRRITESAEEIVEHNRLLSEIGNCLSDKAVVEFRQCETAGIGGRDSDLGIELGKMLANIINREVWLYNCKVPFGDTSFFSPSKFLPE